MARRDELKAEWASRPPTVRALAVWIVVAEVVGLVYKPGVVRAFFSLLVTSVLVWGIWMGNRGVWLLLLIGSSVGVVSALTNLGHVNVPVFAFVGASLALLLAPSTQEWVRRQTRAGLDAAAGRGSQASE